MPDEPPEPGDPATAPAATTGESGTGEPIRIDLPENLELRHLVDIVTDRLQTNILYDPVAISGKTVTVRSPAAVPEQSLLHVLESALQLNGLALVETGRPGWRKIVPINLIQSSAPATAPAAAAGAPAGLPATPVTQVFTLRYANAGHVTEVVRQFLTQPGGMVQPVAQSKQIVVTDFGPVVERVGQVLELIDRRDPEVQVEVIPLAWSRAADAASLLSTVIQHEDQFAAGLLPQVYIGADPSSNQVVIVGYRQRVADVAAAVRRLDSPVQTEMRVYRFKALSAQQARQLVAEMFEPLLPEEALRVSYEGAGGALVVAAPPAVHEQLAHVLEDLDVPAPQSPVQFYKLKNTIARDVLDTLASLAEEEGGLAGVGGAPAMEGEPLLPPGMMDTGPEAVPMGPAGEAGPPPTNVPQPSPRADDPRMPRELAQPPPNGQMPAPGPQPVYGTPRVPEPLEAEPLPRAPRAVRTRQAIVSADENTNSIIVIAPPPVQAIYGRLIEELDQRRPQVLIECTIVALDTSDGFTFGVELSDSSSVDDGSLLTFSSFGLSEVDPETGELSLIPGLGGNIALLGPDMANVVIQALATNSRSRLLSMPKVLVNDNEEGRLQSETEVQTLVISDRETGGTITSVGQPVTAGTTITVTPHISQIEYLQLEYEIELSAFLSERSPELPPDTQRNSVRSAVTIPDGHTIVVGGLSQKIDRRSKSSVPILGEIPIVEWLFSSRTSDASETTLFVFIRPVILRDDKFRDLRYYSGRHLEKGELEGDLPVSQPLMIREP